MSEIRDECGVAAIYHLPGRGVSPLCAELGPNAVSRLMPRMLLDIQNRGQLAAGMTSYDPNRNQLIDTYKDVGTVCEVFRMNHRAEYERLIKEYDGRAAIGHVRLRDVRRRRPRLRAAVRAAPQSRSTSGSASRSTVSWPTT